MPKIANFEFSSPYFGPTRARTRPRRIRGASGTKEPQTSKTLLALQDALAAYREKKFPFIMKEC
jgi:hypothetical protein